jgi:hypothetical protein
MLFVEESAAAAKATSKAKAAKGPSFAECGERWRSLSPEDKDAYKQRAAASSSRSNVIDLGGSGSGEGRSNGEGGAAAAGPAGKQARPAQGAAGDCNDDLVLLYPDAAAAFLSADQRAKLAASLGGSRLSTNAAASAGGKATASKAAASGNKKAAVAPAVPPATLALYAHDPERALRVSRSLLARFAPQLALASLGHPPPAARAAAAVAKAGQATSSSAGVGSSRASSRASSSSAGNAATAAATLAASALALAVREAEELRCLCASLPLHFTKPPQWRTGGVGGGGVALQELLGAHLFVAERVSQGMLTSFGRVKVAVRVKGGVEFTHDDKAGALKVGWEARVQGGDGGRVLAGA